MITTHSALYLLARGLPGLVNLAAIKIYTTLLTPAEFGRYALALAVVGLANPIFFQWIKLSVLRFMPGYDQGEQRFGATIAAAFAMSAATTGVLALAWIFGVGVGERDLELWLLAIVMLWGLALYEMHLDFARIRLKPTLYGLIAITRSLLGLFFASLFIWLGWGPEGLMLGLVLGYMLSIAPANWRLIGDARAASIDPALLKKAAIYGAPLAAAAIAAKVVDLSDRFMIGWMIDEAAVGRYAAVYDLAQHSLLILMSVVNVAGYPLVVRALERDGVEAAREQLRSNFTMLVAVGLPACTGFVLLAPAIVSLFLGEAFRDGAAEIAIIIAGGILFAAARAFYFDLGFHLGGKTMGQFLIHVGAAIVNVTLNFALIPTMGVTGAAWATLIAFGAGMTFSALLAPRAFPLPAPTMEAVKVLGATAFMGGALLLLLRQGEPNLLVAVGGGGVAYALGLLALDVAGVRARSAQFLRKVYGRGRPNERTS